jgi:DNA-binding FadR family transcriptional regulator
VRDILRAGILAGAPAAGEKLPSEAALIDQFKVSRTVVRDAIAALRQEGLVEPRRGAGVFVLAATDAHGLNRIDPTRVSSVVEGLELRTAIEVESAYLAAARASPMQEEAMIACFQDVASCIAEGRPTVDADFSFHLAIANASNNRRFVDILTVLGNEMIPRGALDMAEASPPAYLERLQEEHRAILTAITQRDQVGAREAMRAHLSGSQDRYRAWLTSADPILL